MAIYEKLAKARVLFQEKNIKKSGQNSYQGYKYYELNDILPVINKICEDLKIVTVFSIFGNETAELNVIDSEKPEEHISFSLPMSSASLKGAHAVQNLGAVQTYLKRYLYQNAFEIAESDCLDCLDMSDNKKQTPPPPPQMKGVTTPEEGKKMKELLRSTYSDGKPIFTKADAERFSKMRVELTAAEVIALVEKEKAQREQGIF